MADKNYKSFTGLKEFYYGVLNSDEDGIEEDEAERIEFLQEINVEIPQEVEKAHGDNKIAEIAIATDSINLTTTFHTIPVEDRAELYGWGGEDGEYHLPADPQPPYVACMFARTSEDGGMEWLGFPKGIFTMPEQGGNTKEDEVEFGSDETEGEFMQRKVDGIDEETPFLVKKDKPGETEMRDKMYEQLFGTEHPEAGEDDTP